MFSLLYNYVDILTTPSILYAKIPSTILMMPLNNVWIIAKANPIPEYECRSNSLLSGESNCVSLRDQ